MVVMALEVPKVGAVATLKKFVTIRENKLLSAVSNCRCFLSPYTGI
jgi:hypothetical protein